MWLTAIGSTSASAQLLPRDRLLERFEAQADSLAALADARADTIAGLQWLLEENKLEHAQALDLCEERADSLQISLSWSERWREGSQAPEEGSSFLDGLTSPPVMIVSGFVLGAIVTVQVMRAVD